MTSFMCVNGFSGAGKSAAMQEVRRRRPHRVRNVPRVTTRRLRKGEPPIEYEVVSDDEFSWRISSSAFRLSGNSDAIFVIDDGPRPVVREEGNDVLNSTSHLVHVRKKAYRTGNPNPRFWPTMEPDPNVDIVFATFGYSSPMMKEYWESYVISHHLRNALPMVTVFISMHDEEELRRRLKRRCTKEDVNFIEKWRKNLEHWDDPFETLYDHVIFNDGTIEECADKLEIIAGLRPAQ